MRLRAYHIADEESALALWQRAWQFAYPHIDFKARADWWRNRWRETLVPRDSIVMAEDESTLAGFVTINPGNAYLDQLVVAPEFWNRGVAALLLDEAKRLSPDRIDLDVNRDNARAIRFYQKNGFAISGESVNPHSEALTFTMRWQPN